MDTVGRLASGIAHDFNNLITAINGTADLASLHLEESDPLRRDLERIRETGERAASLYDVLPTSLKLLRLPVPKNLRGKPLVADK